MLTASREIEPGGVMGVGGIALVGMAIVGGAQQPAVLLAGRAALTAGDDVIDVAATCPLVAPGGMLAVAISNLDGSSQSARESAAL